MSGQGSRDEATLSSSDRTPLAKTLHRVEALLARAMAVASQTPPTPLAELRRRSHDTLANLRPSEYSIRAWSSTARVAFETAERCWREGQRTKDPRKVEEAFLEYKRAAG